VCRPKNGDREFGFISMVIDHEGNPIWPAFAQVEWLLKSGPKMNPNRCWGERSGPCFALFAPLAESAFFFLISPNHAPPAPFPAA